MRLGALCVAIALAGCEPEGDLVRVEIATVAFDALEGSAPRFEPPDALVRLDRRGPGRYRALVRSGAIVRADDACPRRIANDLRFLRLAPIFSIEGERTQIGFEAPFELRLVARCAQAERARVRWSMVGGAIDGFAVSRRGRVVRGRMPGFAGEHLRTGIVPISPSTRGTLRLRLTVELGGRRSERMVELHAAARATGVPSVAVGTRVYVGGERLALIQAPNGSHAALRAIDDGLTHAFSPDVRGRYTLASRDGPFTIYAGTHAATDLDCGRAPCHAEIVESARTSPMTSVLARLIETESYAPGCALACHATGEPGVADGGLSDVASELGTVLPSRGGAHSYARLPRELRRAAGVGCTSCHGPGAIPEPGARERILRDDVCAYCHDARPRYGHVLAWRRSRMSRTLEVPSAACARCHTTGGFLGRPDLRGPIACAACHAVHAPDSGPALTRRVSIPNEIVGPLATGSSRVCVPCHSPDPSFDLPSASVVALVTGRLVFGAPQRPHALLPRGCLSCHGTARVAGAERGGNHAFGVDPHVCRTCHDPEPAPAELAPRLAALRARYGDLPHQSAQPGAPTTAAQRARWNAALLLNDGGAWAHAGRSAIAIADAALAARD